MKQTNSVLIKSPNIESHRESKMSVMTDNLQYETRTDDGRRTGG